MIRRVESHILNINVMPKKGSAAINLESVHGSMITVNYHGIFFEQKMNIQYVLIKIDKTVMTI